MPRRELPLIVAHSGVFRVLCRTLSIVEQDGAVTNALPLQFERIDHGWRMTPLVSIGLHPWTLTSTARMRLVGAACSRRAGLPHLSRA